MYGWEVNLSIAKGIPSFDVAAEATSCLLKRWVFRRGFVSWLAGVTDFKAPLFSFLPFLCFGPCNWTGDDGDGGGRMAGYDEEEVRERAWGQGICL